MIRTNSFRSLAFIGLAGTCLVVASACTTRVAVDDDGSGAGGGGTGGSGGTCSLYDDQSASSTVTVSIVNDSGVTIYLPSRCGALTPTIEPATGYDGANYVYDDSCLSTCEHLRTGEPIVCTAEACALETIAIEPGMSHELLWDGTGLESAEMPAACWLSADYGPSCEQIVVAPAGDYTVGLVAYDGCNGDCTCEGGVCWGEASGNPGYADDTRFSFPGDGSVEIVFGPCAFGCAEED
jgi:hypothetical protein